MVARPEDVVRWTGKRFGWTMQPWSKWYHLKRWERMSRLQLRRHPLCRMCLDEGKVEPATIADHVVPHKGDPYLFWFGELQSLCSECHSSSKAQLEHKGFVDDIGVDGFPIDDLHPFNKASKV